MSAHTDSVLAVVLLWCIVCLCEGDVTWKRDRVFDGVIKTDGYLYSEVTFKGNTARYCASSCTTTSWCSSFFFLPSTGGCILNKLVFARTLGGQPSPGARFFKPENTDCPLQDGYVWLRGQNLCFKVYDIAATFHNAYTNCTSVATQLVILDSGDKNFVVNGYLKDAYDTNKAAYVGAVRDGAVDGSKTSWSSSLSPLRWLNGRLVATSGPDSGWGSGDPPSNTYGIEGCMEISRGKWNDIPCYFPRRFICEKTLK